MIIISHNFEFRPSQNFNTRDRSFISLNFLAISSSSHTYSRTRSLPCHWGRGGLETNENILSTLQALVESTCHLPADNRLGTFQMFLQVPG